MGQPYMACDLGQAHTIQTLFPIKACGGIHDSFAILGGLCFAHFHTLNDTPHQNSFMIIVIINKIALSSSWELGPTSEGAACNIG